MSTYELTRINQFVLEKHHLTKNSKIDDIIQITEHICGLHSTDLKTSYLSLFARTKVFKKIDLERELYKNKTLGRIRGMRRTLFIQTKNMIPIIHAATFGIIENSFEKYMEVRGVSMKEYQEILPQILEILKSEELSASEIRTKLNSKLDVPAIIQVMCDYGLLIRGKPIKNWKDRRNRYALFKEYFPDIDLSKINEKEAIQNLVEKYIKAYGPVSETDISWWTGINKTKIRESLKTIEYQLKKIQISELQGELILHDDDVKYLERVENSEETTLTLLPELDPYPMGYKERDRYISNNYYNKVFDKSGNITSTVLLDGVVIGVWDTEYQTEPVVKLFLFQPIEEELRNELYNKAQKVGKFFFDEEVLIKECKSMTPLTERAAGGFMTPLKNC
ncbi:MAG: winged helix DNA-binding domain-containing protein [Candidatus Hodarchaeota archaeon]